MALRISTRWRSLALSLLFGVSLAALLVVAYASTIVPQEELIARDDLRSAGSEIAIQLKDLITQFDAQPPGQPVNETLNRNMSDRVASVLNHFPGMEGGAYLNGQIDQFVGFAHPPASPGRRRDPPPLEGEAIRIMTRRVLRDPSTSPIVEVRDIGPSRVALGVVVITVDTPVKGAAWVMIRLQGPEQQHNTLRKYKVIAAIAAAVVLLTVAFSIYLQRKLNHSQKQQEQLRDGLRRAENMATIGRMLAGMAHEVRNPLAGIRSTVQLWERLPDQSRSPESLAAVVRAVDRMEQLVSGMLMFARSGQEVRQPTDLNALIRETIELLRARAFEQRVLFALEPANDLPSITAASPAIHQVLLNLIANSLQAMPSGGTVFITTAQRNQQIELTIRDTGPGVAREHRDRLFEPFYTNRVEGTGLGLALCREIVEQHGGGIEYVPEDGKGAIFRLYLPIRAQWGDNR